ncbi:hypothetical protein CP973_22685 [Streptomyces albofaciens JCM 4342]|uniref:hypothetical protein n=1 Tax=Streptomyces albofaciens TaxID=66866 RepID=UPI00123C1F55|nr:hypothetical protein [Streptomyces albofaciens]KAA6212251.1 hypothetical protein CP973_22685 [Streptomyces albofaciens JCM 4342]
MAGTAALLGVAALAVSAVPAGALPAGAGGVVAAQRSAVPALVESVREPTPGTDFDVLLDRVDANERFGAGGGWWAASKTDDGAGQAAVWAGRADGTGAPERISPDDGRSHVSPVTDGKTVVWLTHSRRTTSILARSVDGGPVTTLWWGRRAVVRLAVDGDLVVFEPGSTPGGRTPHYIRLSDENHTRHRVLPENGGKQGFNPSVKNGRIAYTMYYRTEPGGPLIYGTEVFDTTTGTFTMMGQLSRPTSYRPTAITGKHVYWLVQEERDSRETAVRRADLDGTNVVDLSPGSGPEALQADALAASEEALNVSAQGKLWQFSLDGTKHHVSCAAGGQTGVATPGGRQVIWVDSTSGTPQLVTRTRPVERCR